MVENLFFNAILRSKNDKALWHPLCVSVEVGIPLFLQSSKTLKIKNFVRIMLRIALHHFDFFLNFILGKKHLFQKSIHLRQLWESSYFMLVLYGSFGLKNLIYCLSCFILHCKILVKSVTMKVREVCILELYSEGPVSEIQKHFLVYLFLGRFWGLLLWSNIAKKWNKSDVCFTQNILLWSLRKQYKTCFLHTSSYLVS